MKKIPTVDYNKIAAELFATAKAKGIPYCRLCAEAGISVTSRQHWASYKRNCKRKHVVALAEAFERLTRKK